MTQTEAVRATLAWVRSFVIELGLCPFAAEAVDDDRLRIRESAAVEAEALLADLDDELARLLRTPVAELETTLLVHPRALRDFDDYCAFLELADALLVERGCEGVVQIASFHPDYCFGDGLPDDPASFTNRSPYPMLHLLREDSVADAIEAYGDIESVPERNVRRLRAMGGDALRERLAAVVAGARGPDD